MEAKLEDFRGNQIKHTKIKNSKERSDNCLRNSDHSHLRITQNLHPSRSCNSLKKNRSCNIWSTEL